MQVGVLGPLQVHDPAPLDLGAPRQRALLVALALYAGRAVPLDALVDLVWGDAAPAGVQGTVQAYVSGLRRVLEPTRERRAAATVLITVGTGYALQIGPEQLDASRFTATVRAEHARLSPYADLVRPAGSRRPDAEVVRSGRAALEVALAQWRGEPYAELRDAQDARAERTRLDELRLLALEDKAVADLWLGQHATAAAELEALTGAHPLRERLWGLRAVALARGGRQADALAVLTEVRRLLDDELGLELGAELRSVQTAVLRQDPGLDWQAEAPAPAPTAPVTASERWPLVGREAQLTALTALLADAAVGRTRVAALVGEPGIGKTRLAAELTARARAQGVTVLTGRGSQDDGAPPLWPWTTLLRGLGRALPESSSGAGDFARWEALAGVLQRAAAERPLLVVVDDLHWADSGSVRALRLLVESTESARLVLLLTWRADPPPTGALADLAETLARRQALTLRLPGLTPDEVATVVQAVAGDRPDEAAAERLRERTDGNPFFLVTLAQDAAEHGDLAAERTPIAVRDVVLRRVQRLPEASQAVLRTAAVVGRQFDLAALAAATDAGDEALLDALEPALVAGLVREDGVDRFSFAHALVRDGAYDSWPASRRARVHARLAAALAERRGRESEVARHWVAAGDAHLGRAWRATVVAAERAAAAHAHEQAAELLESALALQDRDPEVTAADRYDVHLAAADAYRWAAQWTPLLGHVRAAIAVARGLGDLTRLGRAAISATQGAIWQSQPYGHVEPTLVAALRDFLAGTPAADDPLRARVMFSLATELYYGSTFAERAALVEQALAMATRLGDDELRLDGLLQSISALWRSATADHRYALAQEAIELAIRTGRERQHLIAITFAAIVTQELGRLELMWTYVELARREAARLHQPYTSIVLGVLVLPLLAMQERFDDAEAELAQLYRLHEQMSVQQSSDAVAGGTVALRMWQGRLAEVQPVLAAVAASELPAAVSVISVMHRSGLVEQATELYRTRELDLDHDDWQSLYQWCAAAEVAAAFDDRPLAARAYALVAPYAGRMVVAGSGNALGPVDAYLALAAHAVGEDDAAGRHAGRATELLAEWELPLAARWWADQREALGI